MMRLGDGRVWQRGFGVAVALCAVAYLLNITLSEVEPGNVWSLSYGIAATVLLFGVLLFGVRRRVLRLASKYRLGRSRAWLSFHIYGGGLFLLLVLMHSGFQWPSGVVTWWLWALSLWTVASGLVGLALQTWIPRVLASGLSTEVLYERIPEMVEEIRRRAQTLVASCDEPVQTLYTRQLAPTFDQPRRRWIYFYDITGGIRSRLKEFRYLSGLLTPEEKEKLVELEQLYRTKLEMDAHYTLQQPLRLWLYTHVPTSLALLAFLAMHLFSVLYY